MRAWMSDHLDDVIVGATLIPVSLSFLAVWIHYLVTGR